LVAAAGCGPLHFADAMGAPDDGATDPFGGPTGAPPTGTKWQGVDVGGDCGRTYRAWVLVDEVCGMTDDPHYADAFHTPMFRDGVVVGGTLYVVDGSTLWALDAADPAHITRQALVTGVGTPIAIAAHNNLLLLAAADEGLVALDITQPVAPVE